MKKSKKLLSLLLAVLLLCSLLPAAASAEGNPEDDYPFVFVHGLMGWGERSMLDPIMPYWGMTTGNLMTRKGISNLLIRMAQNDVLTESQIASH